MMMLTALIMTSFILTMIIISLTLMTSEKSVKEREKMTPFECGFSPFKKARTPFSLRFFMVTLIFLIFDMEIALVMPMGISLKTTSMALWFTSTLVVIIILLGGLLHEWKNGALNWIK